MSGAASIVISQEQLCDELPNCLLGIEPTLGPGAPGANLMDAA